MEIDTNDGTVADASMLPPGQGQARTTCQKWRALLGLAACDLMLSADTSMARRLTQGSPEQKGASTRSQSVWTAPALLDAATRLRVWHTHETSPHTDVCNRSTVTAKGRLQQSFSVYRSMHPHTTPMTLPPSPRHEEGRPTTRAPARAQTRAEGLLDGRPTSARTHRTATVILCIRIGPIESALVGHVTAGSAAVETDRMPTPMQRDAGEPYHHSQIPRAREPHFSQRLCP